MTKWRLYSKHVDDCSLVNNSMEKFVKMGVDALIQMYTKVEREREEREREREREREKERERDKGIDRKRDSRES